MFVPLEQLSAGIQYKYLISGDYLILPVSLTFIAAFTGFHSDFVGFFQQKQWLVYSESFQMYNYFKQEHAWSFGSFHLYFKGPWKIWSQLV